MREKWTRETELVELNDDQLTSLIQCAFPGDRVVAAEFAQGGLANTNIRVRLEKYQAPLLVRVFVRDPGEAQKEFALLQRLQNVVPVPKVFSFAASDAAIVMEYIEDATRLELHVDELSTQEVMQVGAALGKTLAAIHSIKFDEFGFFDHRLKVVAPITMDGAALIRFAHEYLYEKGAEARLGSDLSRELIAFLDEHASLLDRWNGSPCLTHSDFGPSNILIRRRGGSWDVAAILDWEFAFAGTPLFDFGNLLRGSLGEFPHFEQQLSSSYLEAGGILTEEWRQMSKLVDLTAWLDFLVRPNVGSELVNDARRIVSATITTCKVP